MKKIAGIFIKLATFTFIAFTLTILVTSKLENPWGIKSFVVLTGSMQPTISQGSIIFTQKNQNYSKGDIVAFQKNNVTITHRIINTDLKNGSSTFQTKGDANNAADSAAINQSNILGKQVVTVPFIGNVILFMRSLPGFLLLVVIPAFLYISYEFVTIKNELENRIQMKRRIKKFNYDFDIPHLKIAWE